MQPRQQHASAERTDASAVAVLFAVTFGLLVWAGHFLLIYITQATACVLGLAASGAGAQQWFRVALVLLTLGALALVALHILRVYRGRSRVPDEFLRNLTMGNDAIACVGIAWQLYPISLLSVCA